MRQGCFQQQDIHPARGEGDTGVELFLKHQRNAIAEHVAQYAAEDTRNHRADGGNNHGMSGIQRNLCANDGEDHQAQRIQHQKHFAQVRHQGSHECRHHRCCRNDHDVFRVLHPAQRIVTEQNIAHRPAANGGHRGDNNDAEQIHFAATGRQRAGHGFGGNTNDVENSQ